MCDRPTLSDLALTSAADDAVTRSLALIQRTRRDLAATGHLIKQGRQSVERSMERLRQSAPTDHSPQPILLSGTTSP